MNAAIIANGTHEPFRERKVRGTQYRQRLALPLAFLLCGCSSRHASRPIASKPTIAQVSERIPARSNILGQRQTPSCTEDSDCKAQLKKGTLTEVQGTTLLCENHRCEYYSSDTLWEWAKGVAPSLRREETAGPRLSQASWMSPGRAVTLYVSEAWLSMNAVTTRSKCVGITFAMHGDGLTASVDIQGLQWNSGSVGCPLSLTLGDIATVVPSGNCPFGSEVRSVG